MSFNIGDKVVCIGTGVWDIFDIPSNTFVSKKVFGPKENDVLDIYNIDLIDRYIGLSFIEYGVSNYYDSNYFRKLSDIQALRDYKLNITILEDLSAPIKISKGLPSIPKPQELETLK